MAPLLALLKMVLEFVNKHDQMTVGNVNVDWSPNSIFKHYKKQHFGEINDCLFALHARESKKAW